MCGESGVGGPWRRVEFETRSRVGGNERTVMCKGDDGGDGRLT